MAHMPVEVPHQDAPPVADCLSFQDASFAWCDGELEASEREAVAAHLTACEPCRVSFAADSVFRSAVRSAAAFDRAPESLRERLTPFLISTTIATSA
jgi:mycothiol system anti-sigma-R factor